MQTLTTTPIEAKNTALPADPPTSPAAELCVARIALKEALRDSIAAIFVKFNMDVPPSGTPFQTD